MERLLLRPPAPAAAPFYVTCSLFTSRGLVPPRRAVKQRAKGRVPLFGPTYRAVVERVAVNVRLQREARGWTQEEAAHQCRELDVTLLRMIESARTNITAATVARLVDGFAVDVSVFYAPAPPLTKRRPGRPRKAPEQPPTAPKKHRPRGSTARSRRTARSK